VREAGIPSPEHGDRITITQQKASSVMDEGELLACKMIDRDTFKDIFTGSSQASVGAKRV
jgi:hypothetical protein